MKLKTRRALLQKAYENAQHKAVIDGIALYLKYTILHLTESSYRVDTNMKNIILSGFVSGSFYETTMTIENFIKENYTIEGVKLFNKLAALVMTDNCVKPINKEQVKNEFFASIKNPVNQSVSVHHIRTGRPRGNKAWSGFYTSNVKALIASGKLGDTVDSNAGDLWDLSDRKSPLYKGSYSRQLNKNGHSYGNRRCSIYYNDRPVNLKMTRKDYKRCIRNLVLTTGE